MIFFKKTTKLNSQSAQYKKNKIDKDHFRKKNKGKIHNKKKKNLVWIYYSNLQCFKEKNYIAKFSTSSILKKLAKIILKKKHRNKIKIKKNMYEKLEYFPHIF
jgi:hypothetical protein